MFSFLKFNLQAFCCTKVIEAEGYFPYRRCERTSGTIDLYDFVICMIILVVVAILPY